MDTDSFVDKLYAHRYYKDIKKLRHLADFQCERFWSDKRKEGNFKIKKSLEKTKNSKGLVFPLGSIGLKGQRRQKKASQHGQQGGDAIRKKSIELE